LAELSRKKAAEKHVAKDAQTALDCVRRGTGKGFRHVIRSDAIDRGLATNVASAIRDRLLQGANTTNGAHLKLENGDEIEVPVNAAGWVGEFPFQSPPKDADIVKIIINEVTIHKGGGVKLHWYPVGSEKKEAKRG
jgi:hypothetical protein